MGLGNNALRQKALPFRAVPYLGPLYVSDVQGALGSSTPAGGIMRFARPFAGDIISAKLTMAATFPPSAPNELRFFKGDFMADGVNTYPLAYPLNSNHYTAERIARDWKQVSGSESSLYYPFMGNVFFDGIDITPLIPKRGDPDYNEDGFAIGIELTYKSPGWVLYEFKIDCTAQLGAL